MLRGSEGLICENIGEELDRDIEISFRDRLCWGCRWVVLPFVAAVEGFLLRHPLVTNGS